MAQEQLLLTETVYTQVFVRDPKSVAVELPGPGHVQPAPRRPQPRDGRHRPGQGKRRI